MSVHHLLPKGCTEVAYYTKMTFRVIYYLELRNAISILLNISDFTKTCYIGSLEIIED